AQGANNVNGSRAMALHPMGSLDDHAYVLQDAGVETLIFDPAGFDERAAQLREKVPGLRNLFSFGPSNAGTDLIALAADFTPGRLEPQPVDPNDPMCLAYTGGTTGKPKGVEMSFRGSATMLRIQMTEWEWPDDVRFLVCTPLSHAGAAFWNPTAQQGGSIVVLPYFHPTKVLEAIEKYKI